MRKKILVITGSRAEYGLLKPTMEEIRRSRKLELRLLVTGMHTLKKYGLTLNQIKKDKLPVNFVGRLRESDDMLSSLTKEINLIKNYCRRHRPDFILVLGDRDEALAGAVVGGHLKIPVGHIHGGDVTGYLVDEYIRHAITKFSQLHFVATPKSYERVVRGLSEEKWRVKIVGAPGLDGLRSLRYLSRKELAAEFGLDVNKKWMLLLQHSTPLDKINAREQIKPTLKALEKFEAEKIIIYPNSDTGGREIIKEIERLRNRPDCRIFKNLERIKYLSFLKSADVLVGNSSSGLIESSFFKIPVVNVGNRQKGRERGGNVLEAYYDSREISRTVEKALTPKFRRYCRRGRNPYGDGRASKVIVHVIEKMIDDPRLMFKKFVN